MVVVHRDRATIEQSIPHGLLCSIDSDKWKRLPCMPSQSPTRPYPSNAITVQSLGSSSSGNSFLITLASTTLMVDCGVGIRTITKALRERSLTINDIDAICVTHEHSDHIRTLPKVIHPDAELYATGGTAIRGSLPKPQHTHAIEDQPITIGGVTLWPLPVSHDAVEPCGFMAELPDGSRITMLTDLGSWSESLREFVRASDLIILEANHDEQMLQTGPYPTHLKRRVASSVGHLSNRHCGLALGETLRGTGHEPTIWLAHLSEHNNRPALAEETVRAELERSDLDLAVRALPRKQPGDIWIPANRTDHPVPFERTSTERVEQLSLSLF